MYGVKITAVQLHLAVLTRNEGLLLEKIPQQLLVCNFNDKDVHFFMMMFNSFCAFKLSSLKFPTRENQIQCCGFIVDLMDRLSPFYFCARRRILSQIFKLSW